MKIHVVQPVIPHYRVPFFKSLITVNKNINFYASDVDDIGVESVNKKIFNYIYLGEICNFFGIIWQVNIFKVVKKLEKDDILIINGNPRYLSNLALMLAARIVGCKLVWWGQGWSSKTSRLTLYIRSFLMKFVDVVLLYTDKEKELFQNLSIRHKLYSLNNGLDNTEIKKHVLSYLPDKRDNSILFIGRLTNKSRLEILIKALASIDKNIALNVIGNGPNFDAYRGLAIELGLENRVSFFGAITNEEEIANIANSSKIFVYPGDVGLSLIHAFNYGLPAIVHSSTSQHMPEISCFTSGGTGEFFEINNIASLSNAIESLMNSNVELIRYSCECKKRVSESYNIESMVSRFFEATKATK